MSLRLVFLRVPANEYWAGQVRDFFVLAPNLTIYNNLIIDFTPNTRRTCSGRSRRSRGASGDLHRRDLYPVQKFQSDTERKLPVIVDRGSLKWFRPAKGQFQIYYLMGGNHQQYQPDFVAKRDAAVEWCGQATSYAESIDGKPWKYLLVPHDAVTTNMTLRALQAPLRFGQEAFWNQPEGRRAEGFVRAFPSQRAHGRSLSPSGTNRHSQFVRGQSSSPPTGTLGSIAERANRESQGV